MTTRPYGSRVSALALVERLGRGRRLPVSALLHLTRRCNFGCRHCFQAGRDGPELAAEAWGTVLRRLADGGVLFVTFTGGEPLLHAGFREVLRRARSLSFAVKVKTNGFLLDREACDALSAAPVMEVHLSFYSADPVLHDRVTGVAGSHARVVAAARRLKANGTAVVLNCPVMRDTFAGYGRVVEFAAAEGLDYMFDPGIRVREDGCEDAVRYRLSDRQYAMLLRDRRLFVRPPAARRGAVERQRPCGVGRGVVSVAPNGDVWPCPRIADPVGNLARDALESVWLANPLLARYAGIRWGDLPACRACEWVRWCDRCHADALQEDGDLLGPSRFACRRARIRAALARRCATGVARGGGSHRLSTVAGAAGAAGGLSASKGG